MDRPTVGLTAILSSRVLPRGVNSGCRAAAVFACIRARMALLIRFRAVETGRDR
jgi:hypothetical protein